MYKVNHIRLPTFSNVGLQSLFSLIGPSNNLCVPTLCDVGLQSRRNLRLCVVESSDAQIAGLLERIDELTGKLQSLHMLSLSALNFCFACL